MLGTNDLPVTTIVIAVVSIPAQVSQGPVMNCCANIFEIVLSQEGVILSTLFIYTTTQSAR